MLQSRTRWRMTEMSEERVTQLAEETGLSPLLAKMLLIRGVDNKDSVQHFLHDGTEALLDPFKLAGMREAVLRIQEALQSHERIWIYGDYDADGVSSTSLLVHLMRQLEANFDYYIPHRANEGYGLNTGAIDLAKEQGVTLIVTVDTGISAVEQVAYAKALGIDIVVTDHHEPPEELPEAYALVNPKLPYCPYPFKGLAGVGVAFKLAHALLGEVPYHLLELAAIGTIADLMPLMGENRVIVREALKRMQHSQYPGIKALMAVGNIEPQAVNSISVAFSMAPRINASGRLEHAGIAVELMTTDDDQVAVEIASELDRLNKERQKLVETMVKEAEQQLAEKIELYGEVPKVIVLSNASWNVGVIGIVASKIVDRYYRPTFILGIDEATGKCKGSARSIDGFDLYESMTEIKDVFEHYGGHTAAAGMTVDQEKLAELESRLIELADRVLNEEHFIPCTDVDAACELQDISLKTIEELSLLEPYGMGNSSPRVLIHSAVVAETRTMGKEGQHLKIMLKQNQAAMDAVAFQKGALKDRIADQVQVEVLGELSINEWNGSRKPQLMLQDIRINERQLFDYRYCSDPVQTAVQLARKLNDSIAGAAVWSTTLKEAGVHAAESFVDCLDRQTEDNSSFQEHVKDVIISSVPESAEAYKALAKRYPAMQRMHVVLPKEPSAGKLRAPSRQMIVPVFAHLRELGSWKDEESTLQAISMRTGMSKRELRILMNVFADLAFVQVVEQVSGCSYEMVKEPKKTSLESSSCYQAWSAQSEWESLWYRGTAAELREKLLAPWNKQ